MAAISVAALAAAPLPARLAAQATFEGVVTYVASTDRHLVATMWVKGTQVRIESPGSSHGPRTIIRDRDGRILILRDAAKQYVVMGAPPPPAGAVASMRTYVPTGKRETVAGQPCAYYRIAIPRGDGMGARSLSDEALCIGTALGFVGLGPTGPLTRDDELAARSQFRDGFMILKTERNGAPLAEAARIEPTAVSDDRFAPPAGFTMIRSPVPIPER
jgi:hypothetical protein